MRKTLRRVFGSVVVCAVVAASRAVCPQPVDVVTPRAEQLVPEIQAEQSRNGPHSTQLIDLLRALSQAYRESEDRRLATAATERALEIVRTTSGFASLDQAPLLQELLEDDEARGDRASARERERALLELAAKNPNDLRTVPIYRALADKKMNLHRVFVAGEYPAEIELPLSRQSEEHLLLRKAWDGYWDAMRVLRANGLYSSDELHDLEMKIVRSAYQQFHSPDNRDPNQPYESNYYEVGKRSYQRLLADSAAGSRPRAERAAILVEMADWDLLFSHYSLAFESYETAYALLEESTPRDASIHALFSPERPIVLPTFRGDPLASNETAESAEHVEMAFEVDRYGYSRRVNVVDSSADLSDDAKRDLVRAIERTRFRPRFADGKLAHRSRVVVRYFVRDAG